MIFTTLSREEIIRKYLELEKENDVLKKQKEAREKELRKYKNPNTPHSAPKKVQEHTKPSHRSSPHGKSRKWTSKPS